MRKRIEPEQIRINPCGYLQKERRVLRIGVMLILLAALPFLQSCDGGDGHMAEEASEKGWGSVAGRPIGQRRHQCSPIRPGPMAAASSFTRAATSLLHLLDGMPKTIPTTDRP